jgi:hypothetical protein
MSNPQNSLILLIRNSDRRVWCFTPYQMTMDIHHEYRKYLAILFKILIRLLTPNSRTEKGSVG